MKKKALTRKEFYSIVETYKPSEFEEMGDRAWARFRGLINYLIRYRYRFFIVFRYIFQNLDLNNAAFLDLGPSPGSFLRLFRQLFPSNRLKLYGAGLRVSEKFIEMMKKECKAPIFEVHLDPKNPDLSSRNFKSIIPLDDQTVDYIYAGEIIEHFINPEWMIKESFRVLKPGGRMIITTPNITRAGNVLKLLTGRSNLERLHPIGSQDPYDEHRGHFHEYSMKELYDLLQEQGFKIVTAQHFSGRVTEMVIKSRRKKMIDLFKLPFCAIPHFRDDIFLVAEKMDKYERNDVCNVQEYFDNDND